MKNKLKPSILPGFMEVAPKEQMIFNDLISQITKVYEQEGCLAIDTPIIEKEEMLLAKSAGETEKQVYRIANSSTKQALRFDLTVPFARYVVQHMNEITFPFKRYQLGKVYRGERNQKGRYREFYQLDLDIINPNTLSIENDAYVISLVARAFKQIGLTGYLFQVSNRKILGGLLDLLKIEKQQEVMGVIDKYDKIGKESCLNLLVNLIGDEKTQTIEKLLSLVGTPKEIIDEVNKLSNELKEKMDNEKAKERAKDDLDEEGLARESLEMTGYEQIKIGMSELEKVMDMLMLLGVEESCFEINFKIIRGLDYYTGTIFETVLTGYENYGSICSGGRYDNLTGLYTDKQMPGVGISIGITRLFFVLKEIGFLANYEKKDKATYLISPIGNTLGECIKINQSLQAKGIQSEVYFNQDALKKQLKYAASKEIDFVVIVGENELEEAVIIIRDMNKGEQMTVNKEEWVASMHYTTPLPYLRGVRN